MHVSRPVAGPSSAACEKAWAQTTNKQDARRVGAYRPHETECQRDERAGGAEEEVRDDGPAHEDGCVQDADEHKRDSERTRRDVVGPPTQKTL